MATSAPVERIAGMDIMRGVAVMGILVANLPAFGLPEPAYFSPLPWGGDRGADLVAWFATFVIVEGKMRGLFSFLFGASMLLVIDRARAGGDSPAAVHFQRMAVLLAIGYAHLYLIWWGDILSHYALVGAIAFLFIGLDTRRLLILGLAMTAVGIVQASAVGATFFASAARATPAEVATWQGLADVFGMPMPHTLAAELHAFRGGWSDNVAWRWTQAIGPLTFLPFGGPETLGAMLLGMAGYRSGFLTGGWSRARYRRWAVVCLSLAWAGYAGIAAVTMAHGFFPPWVLLGSLVVSGPFRVLGFVGYAAGIALFAAFGGRLANRLAAVGRAAFTNYLGTSVAMTFVFDGWGLGQFGHWHRATLYVLAPLAWALMLWWSKPWLDRFRYGPMEWVWRSLARFEWQPMRGPAR